LEATRAEQGEDSLWDTAVSTEALIASRPNRESSMLGGGWWVGEHLADLSQAADCENLYSNLHDCRCLHDTVFLSFYAR